MTDAHKQPPKLSIVIATWQAAKTLERCLDSIVGQSFKEWELVIADGKSTDGTVTMLERYAAHIAWWQSAPDQGNL